MWESKPEVFKGEERNKGMELGKNSEENIQAHTWGLQEQKQVTIEKSVVKTMFWGDPCFIRKNNDLKGLIREEFYLRI